MIAVSKSVLKEKMNEYFQKVEDNNEELVVTQDEVPVLKIIPIKKVKSVDDVFGDVRGKIKYNGDILEPETGEWGELV
jgi:antitoxin (DNA-binding transcriptional repressor) of toxin-antitoxin stability system